jgi:hypothetical protein
MNDHAKQEQLLAEVLAEASPPDFRAALLAETLRLARRRRQFRAARQAAGVLAVAGLLAVLVAQQFSKPAITPALAAKKIASQSYQLVRTLPLPPGAVVVTTKFSAAVLAASVPKIVEVATSSGGFRLINDNELLALLADKPAVLIRTGPDSEELVFANPADQKTFPLY